MRSGIRTSCTLPVRKHLGKHVMAATLLMTTAMSLSPVVAKSVTASSSEGVSLTVYNQNFGLVKDVRKVQLTSGINFLRFEDVAAAIDPTTVNFVSLTAPNSVVVREQNYQYDIMDPTTILSKSVGKTVTFRKFLDGGGEREVSGVLLNPPQVSVSDTDGNVSTRSVGMVLKTGNGVVLNPSGQAELAELPSGLVPKPSLIWKLESTQAGEQKAEISYQTGGINWRSDYVAVANSDDTQADLTSWVTIDNKSGTGYSNAALKLLAGDVHRVQPPVMHMRRGFAAGGVAAMAPQFTEKSFAEYHLYTMAGKTNINNNETKQLSLFNVSNVPTKKLFIYEPEHVGGFHPQGNDPKKVNVKIEVANTEKNNLGMALPKGKVRVYKRDDDGALQFIGEDMIDHTPREEKIRLYIGDAFDLVGERRQMNFLQPSQRIQRITYEISLRNHKDSDATITSVEHAYGQWKILSSSHKYEKKDSRTFEFPVKVPAHAEVKINYEIEIKS